MRCRRARLRGPAGLSLAAAFGAATACTVNDQADGVNGTALALDLALTWPLTVLRSSHTISLAFLCALLQPPCQPSPVVIHAGPVATYQCNLAGSRLRPGMDIHAALGAARFGPRWQILPVPGEAC